MHSVVKINRRFFLSYTFALLAVLGIGYLYIILAKNNPNLFMSCNFKKAFHLYCPGCGGTHAFADLVHFHFFASLQDNPLVLLGTIIAIYYWVRFFIAIIKHPEGSTYNVNLSILWIILGSMILFSIVRNLLLVYGHYDYLGELLAYWS